MAGTGGVGKLVSFVWRGGRAEAYGRHCLWGCVLGETNFHSSAGSTAAQGAGKVFPSGDVSRAAVLHRTHEHSGTVFF